MHFTSNLLLGNLLKDLEKILNEEEIINKEEIIKKLVSITMRINNNKTISLDGYYKPKKLLVDKEN